MTKNGKIIEKHKNDVEIGVMMNAVKKPLLKNMMMMMMVVDDDDDGGG